MNVTINGYVSYICKSCSKAYMVESQSLTFVEDTSPEAEDYNYICYVSQVSEACTSCENDVHIKIEIWEYPEAAINYSYSAIEGAIDIECEFCIEHYFDEAAAKEEDTEHDPEPAKNTKTEDESKSTYNYNEDTARLHEPSTAERYIDMYDDE